jgi:hypothetical protein
VALAAYVPPSARQAVVISIWKNILVELVEVEADLVKSVAGLNPLRD